MKRTILMMKKFPTPLFWLCSALLVISLIWGSYKLVMPPKVRAASPVPYTVVRTEKAFDKAGSLKYVNRYVDAVRADGSMVKQVVTSIENRRTIILASGDEIRVNELIGKKSTYPKTPSAIPSRNPSSSCLAPNEQSSIVDGQDN